MAETEKPTTAKAPAKAAAAKAAPKAEPEAEPHRHLERAVTALEHLWRRSRYLADG